MRQPPKSTWTESIIIDLPYSPFEPEDKTEKKIINHIANGIVRISKKQLRKIETNANNIKKRFNLSKTLIGIDVSNIGNNQISYLENLYHLLHVYPFILINCNIKEDVLFSLALHKELVYSRYILPVFRMISPNDTLTSNKRYGEPLYKLLSGQIKSISIKNLKNLNILYEIDDLFRRLPGLTQKNNNLYYSPPIVWLGVEDKKLSKALSYLFNTNLEFFNPLDLCKKFSIPFSLIDEYLAKSMLFERISKKEVKFRLLRSNVFMDFKRALVEQFETELDEREVIDTTFSDYSKPSFNLLEYHNMGKIFEKKDTFALKILSYLKQAVRDICFDKIVLVDNGHEQELYDLIPCIFPNVSVVRVINFFKEPILYPFEKIDAQEKVLIIIDIINTGDFLKNLMQFLVNKKNVLVTGVFSFIINVDLNIFKIFSGLNQKENISFHNFLEKNLSDINEINIQVQEKRFFHTAMEGYLRFWDTINEHFKFDKNIDKFEGSIKNSTVKTTNLNYVIYYSHKLILHDLPIEKNSNTYFLLHYINYIITRNNITGVIVKDDLSCALFEHYNMTKMNNVDIIQDNYINLTNHKTILIFVSDIESESQVSYNVEKLKRLSSQKTKFFILTFVKRFNANTSFHSSNENLFNHPIENATSFSFYESHLPFYLINLNTVSDKLFESNIKNRLEEN